MVEKPGELFGHCDPEWPAVGISGVDVYRWEFSAGVLAQEADGMNSMFSRTLAQPCWLEAQTNSMSSRTPLLGSENKQTAQSFGH